MTREEVYKKLNDIFREFFDDEEINVTDETTSQDIEGWDSLEHINLIVVIEESFKIKFNIGEAGEMENVGEMADKILAKVNG